MAKKVLSVVVAEQAQRIEELMDKVAALEKELKTVREQKDANYNNDRASRGVIDEVHAMLDAAPNPPPRETSPDTSTYRSPTTLSLIARLLIWVATK
jgi:C4-dicarboxylate-specific signal transduction histidine kinase